MSSAWTQPPSPHVSGFLSEGNLTTGVKPEPSKPHLKIRGLGRVTELKARRPAEPDRHLPSLSPGPLNPGPQNPGSNSPFSNAEIFRFLRASSPFSFTGALVLAALALLALLSWRAAGPSVTAFRSSISVTMNSGEAGNYPNGTPFAPSDLRSPAILEAVFDANSLSDFGVDRLQFADMVGIEAYSPTLQSLTDRFRARLDDKKLTFEERKQIETEFSTNVNSLRGRGVMISLLVPEKLHLPPALGRKIADDIPLKWAELFISRLGVMNSGVPISGTSLVSTDLLKELDYPLAYDYLAGTAEKLEAHLGSIAGLPTAATFISAESGKNITDLQRELQSIQEFRLQLRLKTLVEQGLSTEPEFTSAIYQNQIALLEKENIALADSSRQITGIIGESRAMNAKADAAPVPMPGNAGQPNIQLDGGLVDKIMELSKKSETIGFEQGLLQRKVEIANVSIAKDSRKRLLMDRLLAIKTSNESGTALDGKKRQFDGYAASVAQNLNKIWKESNNFLEEINSKRINYDKTLYRQNEIDDGQRVQIAPWLDQRSMIALVAATIAGALLGFIIYFFCNLRNWLGSQENRAANRGSRPAAVSNMEQIAAA